MGFTLLVEEYCEGCPSFEADVSRGQNMNANGCLVFTTDTIIGCKYKERCDIIRKHLEKEIKNESEK